MVSARSLGHGTGDYLVLVLLAAEQGTGKVETAGTFVPSGRWQRTTDTGLTLWRQRGLDCRGGHWGGTRGARQFHGRSGVGLTLGMTVVTVVTRGAK